MEIMSRITAFQNGHVRYFTGRRCQRGHLSERYTKNGACISCLRPQNLLELVRFTIRCHPDDEATIRELETFLMSQRVAAQEAIPVPVHPLGYTSPEELDRLHAKRLLETGQAWRPREASK